MKRFCSSCGNELEEDDKYCNKCGQKIDNSNTKYVTGNINSQPIKIPKKKNGCLIAVLLFLFIPTIIVIIGINNVPESAKVPIEISTIMKQTGVDKEQAEKILSILKDCGINKVDEMTHDENLDYNFEGNKGYRVSALDQKNIIVYLRGDNTVYCIRWADNVIYDNNMVVSKISDYLLTMDEETNLQINSQKMVKSFLKSPSTADFPNITDWKFHKDKEKIIIQSYVDSQNSFGAMLRSEFQITLTPDGKTATSLIIDGKEYTNK